MIFDYLGLVLVSLLSGMTTLLFYFAWRKYKEKRTKAEDEITRREKFVYDEKYKEYLLEEWKITVQTQMHFNDLIIKFRSIVLSVFIGALGIIFGLVEKFNLSNKLANKAFLFAITFWLCCALLDYFYYNRLLIGSVRHARKFDTNTELKKIGLFGLTETISFHVSEMASKILILSFYLIPLILLLVVIFV
jgi:hypothetical protein